MSETLKMRNWSTRFLNLGPFINFIDCAKCYVSISMALENSILREPYSTFFCLWFSISINCELHSFRLDMLANGHSNVRGRSSKNRYLQCSSKFVALFYSSLEFLGIFIYFVSPMSPCIPIVNNTSLNLVKVR